ncbi:MAG: hypothetical protein U1F83_12355 [Verrucomicrobiota bacterium]
MTATPHLPNKLRRGFRFALIGLIFGFVSLGIAAYRMSVESDEPPRPRSEVISEVLADTIKKTVDKLRGHEAPPPQWSATKRLGLVASICGFIGAVLGCVSWLTREHRRWTWAALCVGVAALAWTHVVVAVALAVGLAILIAILSHL